jgi:hypothetical protein
MVYVNRVRPTVRSSAFSSSRQRTSHESATVRLLVLIAVALLVLFANQQDPAEAAWSSTVTLAGAGSAGGPAVTDPRGVVTTAWGRVVGGHQLLYAARGTSIGWSTPVLLSHDSNADAGDFRIALATDNSILLVWTETGRVWSSFGSDAGFTTPTQVSSAQSSAPIPIFDASGVPTIVWAGANGSLVTSAYTSGTWSSPETIRGAWNNSCVISGSPLGTGTFTPRFVQIGSAGRLEVVGDTLWRNCYENVAQIEKWTRTGSSWSGEVGQSLGAQSQLLGYALDSSGQSNTLVGNTQGMWCSGQYYNGNNYSVFASLSLLGYASWASGACDGSVANGTIDAKLAGPASNGTLSVATVYSTGAGQRSVKVYRVDSPTNFASSAPTTYSITHSTPPVTENYVIDLSANSNSAGDLTVAWSQGDTFRTSATSIAYARTLRGGTLGPLKALTDGTTFTRSSAVTTSSSGYATVFFGECSNPLDGASCSLKVARDGVPGTPISVTAAPSNGEALVTWTAPSDGGATPISAYRVTASPGGQTCTWSSGPLQCTVTGLTNGQSYTFTVTSTNSVGAGAASSISPAAVPRTVPNPPTGATGTLASGQSVVSWSAPADNGGASITSYTVTSSPEDRTCTWSSGPLQCTVTGLTNGSAYTFTVTATNAAGAGSASSASSTITPRTTPGAPTSVIGTAGNTQAVVEWTPPADNGGAAITGYTVTANPGGQGCTWTSGPLQCTVSGLANGTAHTFTVTATNPAGIGSASSPSDSVTPRTTPGLPTGVTATAGNTQAAVSWTAPASTGGSAIAAYTVTASGLGGQTCTWASGPLTCTVTGLSNGVSYTFTATAANAAGNGSASTPSNAITPRAVPSAPTNVQVSHSNASVVVTWTASASTGGSPIVSYTATANPSGLSCTWTTGDLGCTIAGLTNGTPYSVTVFATTGVGNSLASVPSSSVTPATTPGAPTSITATAVTGAATVTWTAPASNGGATITSYAVTASPGGQSCSWISGPLTCTVTGLSNGTAYTFRVTASNAEGLGTVGTSSSAVMPLAPTSAASPEASSPAASAATVPSVSQLAAVTTGPSSINLTFGGGAAGATHSAACTAAGGKPGRASGPSAPLKVKGLSYGKSYICDVTSNAGGINSAAASTRVTLLADIPRPSAIKAPAIGAPGATLKVSWRASKADEWATLRSTAQLRTASGAVISSAAPNARTGSATALKVPTSTARGSYSLCVVIQDAKAVTNQEQACKKVTIVRAFGGGGGGSSSGSGAATKPKPVGPIGL